MGVKINERIKSRNIRRFSIVQLVGPESCIENRKYHSYLRSTIYSWNLIVGQGRTLITGFGEKRREPLYGVILNRTDMREEKPLLYRGLYIGYIIGRAGLSFGYSPSPPPVWTCMEVGSELKTYLSKVPNKKKTSLKPDESVWLSKIY